MTGPLPFVWASMKLLSNRWLTANPRSFSLITQYYCCSVLTSYPISCLFILQHVFIAHRDSWGEPASVHNMTVGPSQHRKCNWTSFNFSKMFQSSWIFLKPRLHFDLGDWEHSSTCWSSGFHIQLSLGFTEKRNSCSSMKMTLCKRSKENGQTGSRQWKGNSNSNKH